MIGREKVAEHEVIAVVGSGIHIFLFSLNFCCAAFLSVIYSHKMQRTRESFVCKTRSLFAAKIMRCVLLLNVILCKSFCLH